MFLPGVVSLWVAFAAIIVSIYFYFRAIKGDENSRSLARQAYYLATFAILLATVILLYLILTHDFRVNYVYAYSDRALSTPYLVASLWAGQEGSFLIWLLCGMLIGLPLISYSRHYEERTLLVYNLAQLALVILLLRQSPFRFLEGLTAGQVPFDGQGLNPLLQNPWMTIHPPIMFVGYAATAAPFAFAIAALWGKRYDEWVRAALPWALVSLVTLGAAILLGGYWAYITLGWGGYWGWDPVENSSLVPWLTSAALVHGMLLQRGRGRFRKLNFSMALLTFILVLYATFLTRSGVLADFSVHSFVDLGISGWLLANLLFFLILGVGALLWRWREVPTQAGDEGFFSRTVFLFLAIAALLAASIVVLAGTSAPLLTRLATKPAQVQPSFYNQVTLPIGILMAVLLTMTPYLQWRGIGEAFRKRLILSGVLSAVVTAGAMVLGAWGVLYVTFLFFAVFATVVNGIRVWEKVRDKQGGGSGDSVAHFGLGLMMIGIITSSAWDRTMKVVLPLNQAREAFGYTLTFKGTQQFSPSSRPDMLVEVKDPAGKIFMAKPHMFRNEKTDQMVANPDVHVGLTRDFYVSPVEFDPGRPAESGNALDLGKGESGSVGEYSVRFEGFDMGSSHTGGQGISIGAKLTVTRDGKTEVVIPTIRSTGKGFETTPAALSGSLNVVFQVASIDATAGRVRLNVSGAGDQVAKRAILHQGETLTYRGIALSFVGFDLSDFDPKAGKINIGASFSLANGKQLIARLQNGGSATEKHEDAILAGLDGVKVRVVGMNADDKTVSVALLDPQGVTAEGEGMRFVVDVTIKPMIGLLWLGLVVLLIGGVMAVIQRAREFTDATSAVSIPAS